MAENPIGVTFIPTAEQQALGPKRGGIETDLGEAFKILSLRLPRVLGAKAPVRPELLNAPGAAGLAGNLADNTGFNPYGQVFEALVRALISGQTPTPGGYPAYGSPQGGGMASPGGASLPSPNQNGWRTVNESALAGGSSASTTPRISIGVTPGAPVATGPEVFAPEPPQRQSYDTSPSWATGQNSFVQNANWNPFTDGY